MSWNLLISAFHKSGRRLSYIVPRHALNIFLLRSPNVKFASQLVTKNFPSPSSAIPSEAKDIIMYRYENARFFRMLNVFAIAQFGFWIMLSFSSLTLVDVPVSKKTEEDKKKDEDLPFWRTINLGQDKYKYGLGIGSFLMGENNCYFIN